MKLRTERRDVTVTATDSRRATITANAKAFKAFTDNLYSDKPKSITQEIWSNAYDAHVAAGNPDKPFLINLPNKWEQDFFCRDYGTGLSHDEVMDLYLNLFASTKENSNDGVGMWGLGSKVPFSYTDTFTVTSWQNGVVRYYTALKDEHGVPTINFMGEDTTDQPDGLEVRFPVRSHDVGEFIAAARRVSFGFDVKPVVKDQPDYEWPVIEAGVVTDDYYTYKSDEMSGPHAKMGCVLYRIDCNRLDYGIRSIVNRMNIVVHFDIGDLDVTVSREDLSYDPQTIKALETKLQTVTDGYTQEAIDLIESKSQVWDRGKTYIEVSRTAPYGIFQKVREKVKVDLDLASIGVLKYSVRQKSYFVGYRSLKNPKFDGSRARDVSFVDSLIFVEDQAKGSKDVRAGQRIKSYLQPYNGHATQIIWVRIDSSKKACAEEFIKLTETIREPVVLVSSIPDPGGPKRAKSSPVKVQYLNTRNYWDQDELPDLSKVSGIYVKTVRGDVQYDGKPQDVRYNPTGIYSFFKLMGVTGQKLYAVPKTHWKRFDDADNWVYFWYFVDKWLKNNREELKNYCETSVLTTHSLRFMLGKSDSKWVKSFLGDPTLKWGLSVEKAREVADILGVEYKAPEPEKLVYERYPMLQYLDYSNSAEKSTTINNYIKLIDEKKGD